MLTIAVTDTSVADGELLARFAETGDAAAFELLVRRYALAVGRWAPWNKSPTGLGTVEAVKIDVQLLDSQTGKELRRFDGFPDGLPVIALAFRPDGKELLAGAGFFPGQGTEVPRHAKDAKGLRVLNLEKPAK